MTPWTAPTRWSSSPNGTSSARSIWTRVKALLKTPTVIDLRNIYKPADMAAAGFYYFSIGRRSGEPARTRHRARLAQGSNGQEHDMSSTKKRILVTGGAGFLGSHLCERLLAEGNDVLVRRQLLHRAQGQHRPPAAADRISRRCATTSASRSMSRWTRSTTSPARPRRSTTSSTRCRPPRPACCGAINMLGLAKRVKAKIFQASTSEVYGDPTVHPQTEDYCGNVNPIGPRACYDEGKRCAETLFFDYYRQHKLRIRVARIFNTYGPRMHPNDGRVVSNFIVQALKGEAITRLRRRQPDPRLLLCRRPDRGLRAPDGRARRASPGRSISAIRSKPRSSSWPRRSSP